MELIELLSTWGLPIVFAAVFSALMGLPVPAAAFLIAAGALAVQGSHHPVAVIAVAVSAALLADACWYLLGRRFGRRLLGRLCRLSLSPDTCVRQADTLFLRHGARLLMGAKFVPGISMVAVPTSAALGLRFGRFLAFDTIGAVLWVLTYVGLGMAFSEQIEGLIRDLSTAGRSGLVVIAALVFAYGLWKWLRRWRLRRLYRAVRISPTELRELLETDPDALVLDARSALARGDDGRELPRSLAIDSLSDKELLALDLGGRTLITFCTCPSEASAALLAHRLLRLGHDPVRVLSGGEAALDTLWESAPAPAAAVQDLSIIHSAPRPG